MVGDDRSAKVPSRSFGPSPPSVLHVVENLHRGAVENWLVRMLEHARAKGVQVDWTFYCTLHEEGVLGDRARELGARVICSPVPIGRPVAFIRALRLELRRGGYDVLHCHHDLVSALYLMAASGLDIRRRIVHVHNADEIVPTSSRLKVQLYRPILRRLCLAMADLVVGISDHTLDTFIAGRFRRADRDRVHYYGVDPAPFDNALNDGVVMRAQLGLPPDALIMLFAGRMVPEKNPVFAVEVLAELRRLESRAVAIFAGAGSEEDAVRRRAVELGVDHSVRILGWRRDIPNLMSTSEWFILPRPEAPMEGFGLAVVEAQLAGLRLLLSRGIAADPLLPSARYRRLGLAQGATAWAKAALELSCESPLPSEARACLALSPMDMNRALQGLMTLHA